MCVCVYVVGQRQRETHKWTQRYFKGRAPRHLHWDGSKQWQAWKVYKERDYLAISREQRMRSGSSGCICLVNFSICLLLMGDTRMLVYFKSLQTRTLMRMRTVWVSFGCNQWTELHKLIHSFTQSLGPVV